MLLFSPPAATAAAASAAIVASVGEPDTGGDTGGNSDDDVGGSDGTGEGGSEERDEVVSLGSTVGAGESARGSKDVCPPISSSFDISKMLERVSNFFSIFFLPCVSVAESNVTSPMRFIPVFK